MLIRDYVVLGIVLIWVIAVIVYLFRQKKRGKRIGCGSCNGKCTECAGKQPEK